jgi:hypothetical protein
MKTQARWISGIAVVSLAVLVAMTVGLPVVHGQAAHVRWDIINIDFATLTVSAGGAASARANDCVPPGSTNCSKITLTGAGTFVAPAGGNGSTSATTGGGTWQTFDNTGASTGSGTYAVTGLVGWQLAPGTPFAIFDNIGNVADARGGLVTLRISYDDGSRGVLVVSCQLVGAPDTIFEGITASKGFVDYWDREAPPAPPANANRTLFHLEQ